MTRVASSALDPAIAARLKRDADGLVCAVVQQRGTGEVLMVAWMDDEALHRTLTTRDATYWSRSRAAVSTSSTSPRPPARSRWSSPPGRRCW